MQEIIEEEEQVIEEEVKVDQVELKFEKTTLLPIIEEEKVERSPITPVMGEPTDFKTFSFGDKELNHDQ